MLGAVAMTVVTYKPLVSTMRNTLVALAANTTYASDVPSGRPTTLRSGRPLASSSRSRVREKTAFDGCVGGGVVALVYTMSCTVSGAWSHATHKRVALSNTNERMETPANTASGRMRVMAWGGWPDTAPATPTMAMPLSVALLNATYRVLLGLEDTPRLCINSARRSLDGRADMKTAWVDVAAPLPTIRRLASASLLEYPLIHVRVGLDAWESVTTDANVSVPSTLGVMYASARRVVVSTSPRASSHAMVFRSVES